MKHINDALPPMDDAKHLRKLTPKSDAEPDSSRALRVWAQLAEVFGKAFYQKHGSEPTRLWIMAIDRLGDDELKRGLVNLVNDDLEFPPNLSQFVAACRRLPPVRQLGVPQIEDNRPRGHMSYAEWKKQHGQEETSENE